MPITSATHRGRRCSIATTGAPGGTTGARCLVVLLTLAVAACASHSGHSVRTTPAVAYATRADHCTQPDPDTLAAVVRIATDKGAHGSGVVVGQGRVLTAAHVVVDADTMQVGLGARHAPARLLAIDEATDLALLAADTGGLKVLPLTHQALADREEVWAIGYPLAMNRMVTHGQFEHAANGKLYTSAWITAGNSGGGLLRCTGGSYELAGILRDYIAYLRDGVYVNAERSTSVPATVIRDFIQRNEAGRSL